MADNILVMAERLDSLAHAGDGNGNGNGHGYGGGSGYGYGDGNGGGDGDGYGNGYGYGGGDGDGYGNGYGNGYGDGSGDGSGYGDGSGNGSGYGDGILAHCGRRVYLIDGVPTMMLSVHGAWARGCILHLDLTTTPCYLACVGGCVAHGSTLRDAQHDASEKRMQDILLEERIRRFRARFPRLRASYSGDALYEWHGLMTGSCRMGRDAFCRAHNLDRRHRMQLRAFLDLVCADGVYGCAVMRRVRESYS